MLYVDGPIKVRERADEIDIEKAIAGIANRQLSIQRQPVRLASKDIQRLASELIHLFERDRIYTRPDIDLSKLSSMLGITKYQLSELLNVTMRTTFYEIINKYRIDFAKSKLMSANASAIISIATDVGYTSKSTFNKEFRKRVGTTPSIFRRKMQEVQNTAQQKQSENFSKTMELSAV